MNVIKPGGIVRIEKPGPPEVLSYQTATPEPPAEGEVLMSQRAIGVNYVDVFFRSGVFPMPSYPAPVGLEASGVITLLGANVHDFAVGDRVAYPSLPGAYAEERVLPASVLYKLPDDISFDQAAALLVKGLTAHMLLKLSHEVKAGEVVLIHAMAGGVGTLLSQWARHLGATVIGTVGSAAKRELLLSRGFAHVVNLQTEDFAARVMEVTGGQGIDAVYDGTGEATFNKSITLLKDGGSAVLYGWPSGMPVIDEELLNRRGIRLVRAVLNNYLSDRELTAGAISQVFDLLRSGIFGAPEPTVYPLTEAARAHADLESRRTTGSIILRP